MGAAEHGAVKLEDQLCFSLYACAREVVKRCKPELDALDLTYTQYITMMVLWDEPCVTSKHIGARLRLDSGTLTPVLKKLEEKGLLTRCRAAEDERNLTVTLTEAGLALKKRAEGVSGHMGGCDGLSPDEAAQLHALLRKLLDRVE